MSAEPLDYKHQVHRVLKLRQKLQESLCADFCHGQLTRQRYADLLHVISRIMPGVHRDSLDSSLSHLRHSRLTREAAVALAHRLAGNINRLKNRIPVLPWTSLAKPEWCCVGILSAVPMQHPKSKKAGHLLTLKCLSGLPAGLQYRKWCSKNMLRLMASRMCFGRRTKRTTVIYTGARDLVLLRFDALIEPTACRDDNPGHRQMRFRSSHVSFNRRLTKSRQNRRVKGNACEEGFPPIVRCSRCAFGYDECSRATQPITLRMPHGSTQENTNTAISGGTVDPKGTV